MTGDARDAVSEAADRIGRARQVSSRRGELERQVRMARARVEELGSAATAGVVDAEAEALEDAFARLAALESELDEAMRAERDLEDAETTYDQALTARSRAIAQEGGPKAARLALLEKAIADLRADIRECEEAMEVAGEADTAVHAVLEHLREAENPGWGDSESKVWRMREAYKEAEIAAMEAQDKLNRLTTEMADLGQRVRIRMPAIESSNILDFFLGDLSDTESDTDVTRRRVQRVRGTLSVLEEDLVARLAEIEARLKNLETDRETLLAGA